MSHPNAVLFLLLFDRIECVKATNIDKSSKTIKKVGTAIHLFPYGSL